VLLAASTSIFFPCKFVFLFSFLQTLAQGFQETEFVSVVFNFTQLSTAFVISQANSQSLAGFFGQVAGKQSGCRARGCRN
jgi:hypothetical protein